ncbi:SRPBCC domain-containing protein [Pseudoclavibacter endophyticus]|uniref:ATPase n=1 Tax=Pseudoclavibacter endophyticus TaxID=1778590 RepID=A0A6H9WUJ1_9MICO|nr:SRPBCC domain-containing protein [Pseudoclavibacter endophyticus]KAB1650345.1 ATPase [Pseudoclavibacter endophyticus]
MSEQNDLAELSFTVSGHVSRPPAEVYEAVADPDQLSKYFTTGGARGRLEPGADVTWDFDDFPGRFPVTVVEATPPDRLVIEWDAKAAAAGRSVTTTTFEFAPVDDGARTLVTISEAAWEVSADGSRNAFDNCMGWTGMFAALKAWLEHGINLREGFYR